MADRLAFACRSQKPPTAMAEATISAEQSGLVATLGMTHERLLALLNRISDVAARLEL